MTPSKTTDFISGSSGFRTQSWLSDYVRGRSSLARFAESVGASSAKSMADYGIGRNHLASVDQDTKTSSPTVKALDSLLGSQPNESLATIADKLRPGLAVRDPASLVGSQWQKSMTDRIGVGAFNSLLGPQSVESLATMNSMKPGFMGLDPASLVGSQWQKSMADYGIDRKHPAAFDQFGTRSHAVEALDSLLGSQSTESAVEALDSLLGSQSTESLAMITSMRPAFMGPDPDSLADAGKLASLWSAPILADGFGAANVEAEGLPAATWPVAAPDQGVEDDPGERLRALGWWLPNLGEVPRRALRFAASLTAIQQSYANFNGEGVHLLVVWACLEFLDLCAAIRKAA